MASSNIWLEVRKDNGAVLSFFLERPETPSAVVDYIEATQDELLYLNLLEDSVLPAGMVATLDDLQAHRERLQATRKKSAALPTGLNNKLSKTPVESSVVASNNKQAAPKKLSKSEFMAGFKRIDKPSKQGKQ